MLLMSMVWPVQAKQLSVAPKAGQWQINTQNYIEGQDIAPRLEGVKRQARAFLDSKQVAKLDQFNLSQFEECLQPQQAETLRRPAQSLALVEQALGQCQLQLDEQTHNSIRFSGQCDVSKQGVSGQIAGQVTYLSDTEAEGYIKGKGTFPPHLQLLLAGSLKPELELQHQFKAHWQQAQCSH